jgi:hypothetical protein
MKVVTFNRKGMGVQCLLHTLCNLSCKFCFETKEKGIREDTSINIDYIKNLPNEVVNVILPVMKENDIKTFSLYLMGGELFSDNISDSIFDLYYEFSHGIKAQFEKSNIKCVFNVISNGVFTNRELVEKFLRLFDIRLILSYDPIDRFNCDNQKDIWYDSFRYFKDKGFDIALSTLLTKRNMNAYISGDRVFDKIDPDIFIDSNIYVPRLDYHDYLPGDDDLFNFYKWALDNQKFNISDINSILKHSHICQQEFYYAFGESTGISYISNCLEGLPFSKEEYYGRYDCEIEDDTDCLRCKQPLGIQKRGCLMCEYYMECSEMCWSQVLFDKYEMTTCPIQRIYNYIKDNPQIMINFQKWRELYEDRWRQKSINE